MSAKELNDSPQFNQSAKVQSPFYMVYATDLDRDRFLGIASGEKKDIEAYYDQKKGYGLRIEPITVINVTSEYLKHHQALVEERAKLQERLRELNKEINL